MGITTALFSQYALVQPPAPICQFPGGSSRVRTSWPRITQPPPSVWQLASQPSPALWFPSSHVSGASTTSLPQQGAMGEYTQPVAGLQESAVQGSPSAQVRLPVGEQVPPLHTSPVVQTYPSLQPRELFVKTQPVAGLQASVVHTSPSSQDRVPVAPQDPPPQTSPVVQAFPSSQGTELIVKTQPVVGEQVSVVQRFPSLQDTAPVDVQVPPLHTSPVVQASPSLQGRVLAE